MNTSNWSVSDVAAYLRQIGLGQYSQAFAQNDISGLELPYLNDEYLIELGVKSIGHRIKLTRFIKNIQNAEPRFPPLAPKVEDRDVIHPLPSNIYQQLFIKSEINDDPSSSNEPKKECNVCHRMFNPSVIDYHQKVCQETFDKCTIEFARRGLNTTDEDIIDLLVGKVPVNAIKLQKCKFCGKKIAPKLIDDHQRQCQRKLQEKKRNDLSKTQNVDQNAIPKSDFKEKHNQLIELIKKNKKEGIKNPLFDSNDSAKAELAE